MDGIFLDRPNRFIAHVNVNGAVETVHVKNTGRCKELLLPGAAVRLEVSDNPKRKTKYDLVAVRKQKLGWVNMDSQAPNKVVGEWLSKQEFDLVRPEFTYGKSASTSTWKGRTEIPAGSQRLYTGSGRYRVFPGCAHRTGREALARVSAGTAGRVSVRSSLCDPDGRHHRGKAEC